MYNQPMQLGYFFLIYLIGGVVVAGRFQKLLNLVSMLENATMLTAIEAYYLIS